MKRIQQFKRMSNDALAREKEYTWRQFQEALKRINSATNAMISGENHAPLWQLRYDLDTHFEALEALCFEIEYRKSFFPQSN